MISSIDFGAISASLIGIAAIVLGIFNWKIARNTARKSIFTEFNSRYDQMNDFLEEIDPSISYVHLQRNKPVHAKKLIDYLNLCAEEHYWHKRHLVDGIVWRSWQAGMQYWYDHLRSLRELWEEESKNKGWRLFYLEDGEELFGRE